MIRSAILLVSVAHMALAGVANVCGQKPYNEMYHFMDYAPAKSHCAAHYPAQTSTKTVYPKCLTTTSTHVLSTETVTATRTRRCSTHSTTTPTPYESGTPIPYKYNAPRDAAPAPTPTTGAKLKRDLSAYGEVRHHEWAEYHSKMVKCGYDCVQTACSCVAITKTLTTTHKPTCTSTSVTRTVVTKTTTAVITPPGYSCVHDGHKKFEMEGHHDGHRKEEEYGFHDGHRKAEGYGKAGSYGKPGSYGKF